jgi:integrase
MPGSVRIGTPRATALVRVHSQLADIHLEDISELVGHSSTAVTETVYRHEIRPATR